MRSDRVAALMAVKTLVVVIIVAAFGLWYESRDGTLDFFLKYVLLPGQVSMVAAVTAGPHDRDSGKGFPLLVLGFRGFTFSATVFLAAYLVVVLVVRLLFFR